MNAESVLALLMRVTQLKLVPRTGWAMRGLADAETVSDHSFGVAFCALVLSEIVGQPVDSAKLLTMALLHDLPEAVLSDIPSPASYHLPPGAKTVAERDALRVLLAGLPQRERWQAWWREFDEGEGTEGKLVRDADRLDMLLQAYVYEQTTGNRWLEEFWVDAAEIPFECKVSQSLFDALCEIRGRGAAQRAQEDL